MRLLDTNVLVRLIAQDQPRMTAASVALFEAIEREEEEVLLLDTVLAEVVFTLTSPRLYGISRADVSRRVRHVLSLSNLRVENESRCLFAIDLWLEHAYLSYVDAYIAVATREQSPAEVYSFDRGFDRVDGINRLEPVAP